MGPMGPPPADMLAPKQKSRNKCNYNDYLTPFGIVWWDPPTYGDSARKRQQMKFSKYKCLAIFRTKNCLSQHTDVSETGGLTNRFFLATQQTNYKRNTNTNFTLPELAPDLEPSFCFNGKKCPVFIKTLLRI